MKVCRILTLALLSIMVSCSKAPDVAPPAPAPVAAAPAAQPEAPAAQPETPPPAPAPESAAPAAAAEPVATPAPTATPVADPNAPAIVAGKDYEVISDGTPFMPAAGKIEVVEFFNYACPACNGFNPILQPWKAKLPADVNFVYVPVEFRPDFAQYARAYYAAESLGLVEKTHHAVYEGIHETHTLPGEGQAPDEAKIAAFYAKYGVSAEQFQQLMDGFAVNTQIARARQFGMRSRVQSTPSLVIGGKYLVKGKTWEDSLRIADGLIAKERGH